jgi:hypothetical protein
MFWRQTKIAVWMSDIEDDRLNGKGQGFGTVISYGTSETGEQNQ